MKKQNETLENKHSWKHQILASNKKALFDYEVISTLTSGIVLFWSEVPSVRSWQCNLRWSYITTLHGRVILKDFHISAYKPSGKTVLHNPTRERILLLHKKEIQFLEEQIALPGITAVPLEIILQGIFLKVKIGIVRWKKEHNKKQALKERDLQRNAQKEASLHYKF